MLVKDTTVAYNLIKEQQGKIKIHQRFPNNQWFSGVTFHDWFTCGLTKTFVVLHVDTDRRTLLGHHKVNLQVFI